MQVAFVRLAEDVHEVESTFVTTVLAVQLRDGWAPPKASNVSLRREALELRQSQTTGRATKDVLGHFLSASLLVRGAISFPRAPMSLANRWVILEVSSGIREKNCGSWESVTLCVPREQDAHGRAFAS